MSMQEILCKQSKETRCYMMAAKMFFEGYNGIDETTEYRGQMALDVLGLTKEDIEMFPVPTYDQLVAHLKTISDHEVRHWVICNTYSPVLKSRRKDALGCFKMFCLDLMWDINEIKETMQQTEEICELNPIESNIMSIGNKTGSGCFSVIAFIIICTSLLAFTIK